MYVVTQEGKPRRTYKLKLHALDLATGDEVGGGPVVIDATVDGTGGGSVGGQARVRPLAAVQSRRADPVQGRALHRHDQPLRRNPVPRLALRLRPGHARTEERLQHEPQRRGASIWQSGVGIAANDKGLFFCTSNGDHADDGSALGVSVVRMNAGQHAGRLVHAEQCRQRSTASDADLTGGVLLIPKIQLPGVRRQRGGRLPHRSDEHDPLQRRERRDHAEVVAVRSTSPTSTTSSSTAIDSTSGRTALRSSVYPFANGKLSTTADGGVKTFNGLHAAHPGGIMTISANGTAAGSAISGRRW